MLFGQPTVTTTTIPCAQTRIEALAGRLHHAPLDSTHGAIPRAHHLHPSHTQNARWRGIRKTVEGGLQGEPCGWGTEVCKFHFLFLYFYSLTNTKLLPTKREDRSTSTPATLFSHESQTSGSGLRHPPLSKRARGALWPTLPSPLNKWRGLRCPHPPSPLHSPCEHEGSL